MRCLVYTDAVWIFNYVYVEKGEFRDFLGGHMEVFVNPIKEVFEEVDYVVGTQEAI